MSVMANLSALAARGLTFGACQAVGMEAGERSVEPVTRFLAERMLNQGERLLRSLGRANDRAWQVLEFSLVGDSLWDRCTSLFSRGDDRGFRSQLRTFLDTLPAETFAGSTPEFRRQALEELRLARKEGALRVCSLDIRQIAHHAGKFAGYTSPQAVLAAEKRALAAIADCFPGGRYGNLRQLLVLALPDGTPLLATAVRYFFRREIEEDRDLFQGLAFALLERQSETVECGLRNLGDLLTHHAERMDGLLADVLGLATRTHDEVVKIGARLDQLLVRHHLAGRELRPDDTLLTISEEERRLVRELVRRYRDLPDEHRASRVELAFKIGQAEAIAGDLAGAQQDFLLAARLASDAPQQAEAHASAGQAALARGDLDAALAEMVEAARLDPERFAPFPLDKYRPLRILGIGGFGTAFLCRHAFKRDAVVVKALRTSGLGRSIDEVFNEAQILSGLSHPGLVGVIDCDFADRSARDRPFVVMEYFDGHTLASQVAEHGPLSPAEFLPLARQMARGLQAAHERGVLHRDVKPANLLVRRAAGRGASPTWEIKLIDFGLAMRPAWLALSRAATASARESLLGTSIAGTFKYAAPEQLGELPGVSVGECSDIFSFGRTCYFSLLGTPEPDDDEKDQLPEGWRRLLSRCTARLPARRLRSMKEVAAELERFDLDRPCQPSSCGPTLVIQVPPRRPTQEAVGIEQLPELEPLEALPELELAVTLEPLPPLVPLPPARPARPVRPVSASRPRVVLATCVNTFSGHEGTVSVVAFRPDGRILATGGFDDRVRLWKFPGGEPLVVLEGHAADVNGLAFRRDGALLASASDDRDVRLWNVPGGQAGPVLRHPDRVYAAAFSPDGRLLATGCDDFKTRLWSPASATTAAVLAGHTSFVRHLAFSPDGRTLATASGDRTVHLWSVPEGQKRATLVGHGHTIWSVAFSPDGRLLATGSQDRTARIWTADGQPVASCEGHDEIVWSVAFSPDGRLLATGSHDRTVRLWDAADGRQLATLQGHTQLVRYLAFSPDGRYLVTASGDGMTRVWLLHDDADPCDWSAGVPDLPPRPQVRLTRAGNGTVYPGDEAWIDVAVTNTGRGDLVQLRALVESDSSLFRGLNALFGRVRPGETVSRCVGVLLPPEHVPGELRAEVVFQEGNDYQPGPVPVVFNVRPLPRDDFELNWRLVDDGSGNSFGNGDGVPQRGECLDVVVRVENRTGQDLDGLHLVLAAGQVPAGVVVNVPRSELPPVPHGGKGEGRVTFSVKPAAKTGPARFELRAEAGDGRLFARVPVETWVE